MTLIRTNAITGAALLALFLLVPACATDGGGQDEGDDVDDGSGGGGGDGDGDGDGNGDGDGDGGATTAFRVTDLDIRDPHIFIDGVGCQDVTATLNDSLATNLSEDNGSPADPESPDGLLDVSALLLFGSSDPARDGGALEVLLGADCSAPAESTACSRGAALAITGQATNQATSACQVVLPDTTTGSYTPAPPLPQGPCFAATDTAGDLVLDPFVLSDAAVAATYLGAPATGLASGVVRGFMSEADAEATVVETPIGNRNVASLLPGGKGSCASGDARDTGPDGTSGWYFYLEFTAATVDYSE